LAGCLGPLLALLIMYLFLKITGDAGPTILTIGFIVMFMVGLIAYFLAEDPEQKKEKLNEKIKKKFEEENLDVTQQYISVYYSVIGLDEKNKKVCFLDSNLKTKLPLFDRIEYSAQTYSYKDILESEIVIDGETITKVSRTSQVGRALIGAALAGGVGAVIGGLSGKSTSKEKVKKIELKVIVKDMKNPVKIVTFLDESSPINKEDRRYKEAYEQVLHWHSLFKVLIEQSDKEDTNNKQNQDNNDSSFLSVADEIRKLSELLKEGIITQEEFEIQKKKLLAK